jgi:hypothetical protein
MVSKRIFRCPHDPALQCFFVIRMQFPTLQCGDWQTCVLAADAMNLPRRRAGQPLTGLRTDANLWARRNTGTSDWGV